MHGLVLDKKTIEGILDGSLFGCTMLFSSKHSGKTALVDTAGRVKGFTYLDGVECVPCGDGYLYSYQFGKASSAKRPMRVSTHREGEWVELPM